MSHLLLVEDDLSLIEGLEFTLKRNGFTVDVARTVRQALSALDSGRYDLLLLDLTLPDGSGFEICKAARGLSDTPIIFLTASDEEVNVVMGLDMGGDDYITKPFKLNELLSRIRSLLRRAGRGGGAHEEISSNGITLRPEESRARRDGRDLDLTVQEFRLLSLLMQNPGRVLTREAILDRLWDGAGNFVDDNTLSVYVRRLRRKIEAEPERPQYLLTARGFGYLWKVVRENG